MDEEVDESFPASDAPGHNGNGSGHDSSRPADGRHRACRSPTAIEHAVALTLEDGTETELDHGHVVIAAITSLHQHVATRA